MVRDRKTYQTDNYSSKKMEKEKLFVYMDCVYGFSDAGGDRPHLITYCEFEIKNGRTEGNTQLKGIIEDARTHRKRRLTKGLTHPLTVALKRRKKIF